jgi:DNA-binding NarL/FixJ family response regulator
MPAATDGAVASSQGSRRLMLVAAEALNLELFAHHIDASTEHSCVATTASFDDAVPTCEVAKPDLAILAASDNVSEVVDTILRLREGHPCLGIIVVAMGSTDGLIGPVLEAGAQGFLTDAASVTDLDRAIDAVGDGRTAVDAASVSMVVRSFTGHGGARASRSQPDSGLTPREMDVLRLLAEGLPTVVIAERLEVSMHTARTHIKNIMMKLDVHSRLEAAAVAVRRGLV